MITGISITCRHTGKPDTLTGFQVAVAGFSPQPVLAVLRVVEFGDEGEVTRHLAVVSDLEALELELPELHILKGELE